MKHTEFEELIERGTLDEDSMVNYLIEHSIATKDELKELIDIGVFSIQNILNGSYVVKNGNEVRVSELMRTWNDRLGFKFFITV